MNDPTGARLIVNAGEAAREAEALLGESLISLDTETYWLSADSRNNVSLVQIASAQPEVLVFDALACGVEPLRPLVESTSVVMAAHNARFDQGVLRGAGLNPASFIDTLSLARATLHLPSYSLAAVTEHLFGIPLDKTLRTSNWRRRPLTRSQIEYAALDARITLRVYEELRRRLEAEGRWDAARRAALLSDEPSEKSRRRRRAAPVAPAPPLTPEERRTVTALKKWRLERAFAQRVPAYMICPDRTLESLAHEKPETLEQLSKVYGLGEAKIERFGEELLIAIRDITSDGKS